MNENSLQRWTEVVIKLAEESHDKLNLYHEALTELDAKCPLTVKSIELIDRVMKLYQLTSKQYITNIEEIPGMITTIQELREYFNALTESL